MFRAMGRIEDTSYFYNLGMIYLFTIGGAIPTIMNVVRNKKDKNRVAQIGNAPIQNNNSNNF